jgi:hypothetical protein
MRVGAVAVVCCLLVSLAACGTPETTQRSGASSTAAEIASFSKRRAMRHVRKLAGEIGVRVRATRGERRGARYIANEFREIGYKVNVQKFSVDGGTSRNVVAWWPDAKKYPFVIGGHMDSVQGSPGANDNASGVAVILEMARLFAGTRQARLVRWAAFGSEEYGNNGVHHVGSDVYVRRLGNKGRSRLAGMLSVDMVADGVPLLIGHSQIAEPVVARSILRKVEEAGIASRWYESCDCSDNGPFERAGIPAAFMWSGDEPNYHDSSDTVPNMDPNDLARTGRAVRVFARSLNERLLDYYRRRG